MTISLRISIACRNRFIILTLFFFKWKIAVRNFGFSPYSWLIHIAPIGKCEFKKKMKRKTLPDFFVCFTTPPGGAKFTAKFFNRIEKVKIIIIICDDEHNPSFLNVDDYFQMMSWRSSFCDLQNFLRQLFFLKRNNWKQFTSKRWKSMAFWVWITIHLHHCVEY